MPVSMPVLRSPVRSTWLRFPFLGPVAIYVGVSAHPALIVIMRILRWLGFWFAVVAGGVPLLAYESPSYHVGKHGGVVFRSGPFDLELALLAPTEVYALYFIDTSGKELPASVVSDV